MVFRYSIRFVCSCILNIRKNIFSSIANANYDVEIKGIVRGIYMRFHLINLSNCYDLNIIIYGAPFLLLFMFTQKWRKLNWYFLGKGELTTYWLCGKDDYDRPLPNWEAEDGPSHGLKIDDYLNVSSI